MPHIAAIVLAAGQSRRMGAANKLLLPYQGHPLVEHAVATVREAGIREVIVVTGHEPKKVMDALANHLGTVRFAYNPDYDEGMGTSLRTGVAAAPNADGYMICLGDLPLLRAETLRAIQRRFADAERPAICIPVHEDRRGHPVLFDAAFRDELLQCRGDTGARPILKAHPAAIVEVPVDDPGILRDIDTADAYDALDTDNSQ